MRPKLKCELKSGGDNRGEGGDPILVGLASTPQAAGSTLALEYTNTIERSKANRGIYVVNTSKTRILISRNCKMRRPYPAST